LIVELIKNKKTLYCGSETLTAAFCLEALEKYKNALEKKSNLPKAKDLKAEKIKNEILGEISKRFSCFSQEMRKELEKTLETVLKNDKTGQIILLPYYFKKCLGEKGKNIYDELLIKLGAANLCGWLAYTIYDDFLDEEGAPQKLPLANICLRELSLVFSQIFPEGKDCCQISSKILDEIEAANFWEVTSCRIKINNSKFAIPFQFPNYKNYIYLSRRSMGHALGPIAIMHCLGYKNNSTEMKNLISFFEHYIIARQLDDDAHDWERDLKNGQLSPIVMEVMKDYRKKYGKNFIDTKKDISRLQEIFWYETVKKVSKEIIKNANLAQKHLKNISVLENPEILENLVAPVKKSAQNTLAEQKNAVSFLKHFKNNRQ
jgi:hypothetical protein